MTRLEEYRAGEHDFARIAGTEAGKKAVDDFVRALEIRMQSPFERGIDFANNKAEVAAFYFFKWLAEIPGYGGEKGETAKVLCAWNTSKGFKWFGNMLSKEDGEGYEILAYYDILSALTKEYSRKADEWAEKKKAAGK